VYTLKINKGNKKEYMIKLLVGLMVSLNVLALDDFDLYRYGPDASVDIERLGVILKVVLYDDPDKLNSDFKKSSGLPEDDESMIRAFTLTRDGDDVCIVHMIPPTLWDDRETLAIMGHEVLHCLGANHQNAAEEIAQQKKDWEDKNKQSALEDQSEEELYAEDRKLELEWLKKEYEQMGIVITEENESNEYND
jgi:hypothetical protein